MKAKLKWDIEAIWSVFLLFIFSETLHLSDGDTALNFITVFVVSCLPVRLQGAYFNLFFQVTSFPSISVAWLDACVPRPNNCWGRVLFLSVNPSGRRRGMWRWVTANIRVPAPCHTCIQRGRIIFKACRLQHVIRLRAQNKKWKKKKWQTSCIPELIPQSTITSLNSSTPGGGARAHPVVLAALPAHAAQSGSFVAMATGKQCSHA